jgi:protein disulfide-isomerase A6
VCILVFLPHIYDSSANERNRYIDVLSDVGKGYRGQPIRFLWVQAGDFYKLETMIGLGFGFPSVVALSLSKNRFALMRSAYIAEEIQMFIRKILAGSIPLTEYKELPKIKSVDQWDGLDHVLEASNEDL